MIHSKLVLGVFFSFHSSLSFKHCHRIPFVHVMPTRIYTVLSASSTGCYISLNRNIFYFYDLFFFSFLCRCVFPFPCFVPSTRYHHRYNVHCFYFLSSLFTIIGLRKVYPYYFTFTTFTKGRWVGEKIIDVFAREFRAHPVEEYERCIKAGTLTVNYEKVPIDYRLKHNDLLANIVHR